MHRKQRDRMRVKNQKFQKNSRSKSQTTKSKKSEAEKSASQRKPNCPIRNESQHSGQRFWSESSDKVLSSRELRPNIQTIYQILTYIPSFLIQNTNVYFVSKLKQNSLILLTLLP